MAAGVLLAAIAPARATTYSFTTITPPSTPAGDFAFAVGINDNGQVLVSTTAPSVAFDLTDIDDVYNLHNHTYIALPAAPGSAPNSTEAFGINNTGEIVGWYHPRGGIWQGFSCTGGSFSSVNAFGSGYTYSVGISNNGQIVGTVGTPVQQGYVDAGGIYKTVDGDPCPANSSYAAGINNTGEIVLNSVAAGSSVFQCDSFLNVGGVNGAIAMPGEANTCAEGINDKGMVVGGASNDGYATGPGFIDDAGVFTPINVPGAVDTILYGINNLGQVPVITSMRTATRRHSWRPRFPSPPAGRWC